MKKIVVIGFFIITKSLLGSNLVYSEMCSSLDGDVQLSHLEFEDKKLNITHWLIQGKEVSLDEMDCELRNEKIHKTRENNGTITYRKYVRLSTQFQDLMLSNEKYMLACARFEDGIIQSLKKACE